mgnify:CR=1 FL=1
MIIEKTFAGLDLKMKVTDIDIASYQGTIKGDLVVYEKGGDAFDGMVLNGFDEVGMFDDMFTIPQYAITEDLAKSSKERI